MKFHDKFTDPDKCLKFIRRCNDRAIFLIASGTLGQIIVPKVYDYPQIYSIFILCMNITKHKNWATNYSDKTNIFDFDEDLLIRVTNEVARYLANEAERLQEMNEVIEADALYDNVQFLFAKANELQRKACNDVLSSIEIQKARLAKLKEHFQYTIPKCSSESDTEADRLMEKLKMCESFIDAFIVVCLAIPPTYQRKQAANKAFKALHSDDTTAQAPLIPYFTDKDQCFEYIKRSTNKTVSLMILSNASNGEDLKVIVELYSRFSQISAIYVLFETSQDKSLIMNNSKLQAHLNVQFYVCCSSGTWINHREQFRQAQLRIFEVFDEHNLVFQLGQVTGMYYKKLSDYHRALGNDDEADQQLCNAVRINRTLQLELRNQMVTKDGTNVSA
ncbi:unnamed protein product [Didymodactylos carnosus]|uniref:Uncharacterized protein n=1 Tax=Didymodactylos carnosus TaxID=1234261 RepID=A0A8S2HDN4_9BILA|nr:unnamed protein product [Didymodactylos carnosus]CAF3626282.1 unnamed protein product [Didymodactylos carnosus]